MHSKVHDADTPILEQSLPRSSYKHGT